MKNDNRHKPTVETLVNSVALALTSFGVVVITTKGDWKGYIAILFGMALEYYKYWGRSKNLW